MATTMPNRTTWADIPPELVERILQYCDRQSLLALSQLNHQLNSLALSLYFAPQIIKGRIELPCYFTSENLSIGHTRDASSLRVLRTAFSLPRTIKHIDYHSPPDIKCDRYFSDLSDITAFINRMPRLESLTLNSGYVRKGRAVGERYRHAVWNKLLAAAILKGCESLEVAEPGNFPHPRPSSELSKDLRTLELEPQLCGVFRSASNPTITSQGSSSFLSLGHWFPRRAKSPLQAVHLYGIDFRNSPLMFHAILTWHAASITTLSFINLVIWEPRELKEAFDCLHFHALQSFVFSNSRLVSPITFLEFLSRHRKTLTHLYLEAGFRRDSDEILPVPKWSFWRRPLTFPDLRELSMPPNTLAWLVPDFRRCPKIYSIAFQEGTAAQTSRNVIKSTLRNLHAFPSSRAWPLEVELVVPLGNFNALLDFRTAEDGKTRTRWPRVRILKLVDPMSHSHPELNALVIWLSTFPSLEYLIIETPSYVFGGTFVRSLVARCPNFKTFTYQCGRERKEVWDVQNGRVSNRTTPPDTDTLPRLNS